MTATTRNPDNMIVLIASDGHGVYAAQVAAQNLLCLVDGDGWTVDAATLAQLRVFATMKVGELEWYWDEWNVLECNLRATDADGNEYRLHHDGDVFLVDVNLPEQEWCDRFGW